LIEIFKDIFVKVLSQQFSGNTKENYENPGPVYLFWLLKSETWIYPT
jgi:hypothetical protein